MNKPLALDLIKLIDFAYERQTGVQSFTAGGLSVEIAAVLTVHEDFRQVPFGFVATEESPSGDVIAYVILRGTSTLLEWFDDGFALPHAVSMADAPIGHTTDGYERLYRQLSPQIVQALRAIKPTGIRVAGHSLGGALALLAVVDIWNNLGIRAESYTFCAPRAGDPEFAKAFAAAGFVSHRIFNTEDLVPTLPPATTDLSSKLESPSDWLLSLVAHVKGLYQHVGEAVALTFNLGSLEANHSLANIATAIGGLP